MITIVGGKILYVDGKAYVGKRKTKKQIKSAVFCKDICALSKGCMYRDISREEFGGKSCEDFIGKADTYFVPLKEIGGI